MEAMFFSMKTLDLKKIQHEFLMLTLFHSQEFNTKIDQLPVDESTKQSLRQQAQDFLQTLFKLADFDPENEVIEARIKTDY